MADSQVSPGRLSATMVACLDLANQHGGELVRYVGGYWAPRNLGLHPSLNGSEYHGSSTVQALVTRGHAEYSEHREGRNGKFPIAVRTRATQEQSNG